MSAVIGCVDAKVLACMVDCLVVGHESQLTVFLTQVVLSFFNRVLRNPNIYRGAAVGALIAASLDTIRDLGVSMPFLAKLPLAEYGFAWVLPAVLGAVIGAFLPCQKKQEVLSGEK